jgi:thymidylate synthase (FAD)
MNLINPSVEIIPQKPGLQGIYEQIELAARTCYKSEDAIKYDEEGNSLTAKDFVDKIVNVYKHRSVAEHGTVYLKVPMSIVTNSLAESVWEMLNNNKWTKHDCDSNYYYYTTNYRVLLENDALDILEYLCEPTEYHERRVTVRTKCPISVSREWNRHRSLSISEQSTRYCNYSKDKFGNQITFCIPTTLNIKPKPVQGIDNYVEYIGKSLPIDATQEDAAKLSSFLWVLRNSEAMYLNLIKLGWNPQQAREVLTLCTATEVVYTGFISDWKHFFELRTVPNAHPDIAKLATDLQKQFKKQGLI